MAKNITLEMLLARKQQSNDDKMKIVLFNSKVLGGTIEIVKQKA
ncbi:phage portal protein, partial [Legionella pneumophila]